MVVKRFAAAKGRQIAWPTLWQIVLKIEGGGFVKRREGRWAARGRVRRKVRPLPLWYFWPEVAGLVFWVLFALDGKPRVAQIPRHSPPIKVSFERETLVKQIVETPLPETLKPSEADFLGPTDHQTAEETKIKNPVQSDSEPGAQIPPPREVRSVPRGKEGRYRSMDPKVYQALLPSWQELAELGTPHQDYISKSMKEGDVIDVNTHSFRWIGYFTKVRQMVALTFYSPYDEFSKSSEIKKKLEAYGRAEMNGVAVVHVTIVRSGLLTRAEITKSSGDKIVDEFWKRVLELTAPYPPLPKDYPLDTLTFSYALAYDYEFRWQSDLDRRFDHRSAL